MPNASAKAYYRNWKDKPCRNCGQKFLPCQMDAHHVNPDEKEGKGRSVNKLNFDEMVTELDKCIPLCKNCHALIHWEMRAA